MKIKSQVDFFAGLMFLVVGGLFVLGAQKYNIGTAARMGPGYFPSLLGIMLAVLGGLIIIYAMLHNPAHGKDGDKVGSWAWKPIIFVLGANILFGICLGGLPSIKLPAFGLVVGIFVLVSIGGLADKSNQPSAMLRGFFLAMPVTAIGLTLAKLFPKLLVTLGAGPSVVISAVLSVICLVGFLSFLLPLIFTSWKDGSVFKKAMLALGIVQIIAWCVGIVLVADLIKFAADLRFIADVEFKILLAVNILLITPKLATKLGFNDVNAIQLALLISTMCFISVWAFIDGLRLQIPMWPAFITG